MYEKLRTQVLPGLIPPKAKILVAVSGGPDSVALAHVLWRYAQEDSERKTALVITHVNHGVRPESAQEEVLVQRLAQTWGLPCLIHRFNAKKYARENGYSFQEGARAWRYERWEQDMRKHECTHLATAHHLNDQAETVLYRLVRGSGTAGLSGILSNYNRVLRPLLTVTKEEILAYCAEEELPYALDRSNDVPNYVRNKIRLKLLPELAEEYNPQIVQALGRTASLMRWDEEYLQFQTEKVWGDCIIYPESQLSSIATGEVCLSAKVFDQPPALASRVIRRAAFVVSGEPRGLGYDYILRIMEKGKCARIQENFHWKQDFPGFQIELKSEEIWFKSRKDRCGCKEMPGNAGSFDVGANRPVTKVLLEIGLWSDIPELGIKVGIFTDYNQKVKEKNRYYVDQQDFSMRTKKGNDHARTGIREVAVFDKDGILHLNEPLVCRTRKPGDRMWFQKIGHKDLKKIFQEEGIKSERRIQLPLIASGNKVLWIPGVKRSDMALPAENSEHLYFVVEHDK